MSPQRPADQKTDDRRSHSIRNSRGAWGTAPAQTLWEGELLDESMSTDFGQLAAAIDEADRLAGERIGGPNRADQAAVRLLEAKLPRPADGSHWEWLARRLGRALDNGWHRSAATRLIRLAK